MKNFVLTGFHGRKVTEDLYSRSQIDEIYKYIENQESHHEKRTFRKEYIGILIKNEIDFDQRFLFDFWDDSL
jgi:hypothetical protein